MRIAIGSYFHDGVGINLTYLEVNTLLRFFRELKANDVSKEIEARLKRAVKKTR